jgi:hypothetical protein
MKRSNVHLAPAGFTDEVLNLSFPAFSMSFVKREANKAAQTTAGF